MAWLQVHDEVDKLLLRLERAEEHGEDGARAQPALQRAHQGQPPHFDCDALPAPEDPLRLWGPSAPAGGARAQVVATAADCGPGALRSEICLSHRAVSSAQLAALVLLMTREEHSHAAAALRVLRLDACGLRDQQIVMLLTGLGALGRLERLHIAGNQLTKVAAAALAHVLAEDNAPHVRLLALWAQAASSV
jgi:hypothetical protein